ncbi:hypothetical protein Bbelb_014490 [Branchiostoma belcheri]|nr:hypothetical protein Bbelb_014490 [Branchiostoma belcheri]
MPQLSTMDNPVETTHHMVVNDRCETVQHVAAPLDFYLFPKLKFHLRGQRFDGDDDVIYAVEANLGGPDATFFHKGKIKLELHWTKCIASTGVTASEWFTVTAKRYCTISAWREDKRDKRSVDKAVAAERGALSAVDSLPFVENGIYTSVIDYVGNDLSV